MASRAEQIEEAARLITKQYADQGKLIEAGYAVFALYVIPRDAPQVQLDEMRLAYMAGAEHLFSSLMSIMDPGEEPTAADMRRMKLIDKEIQVWRAKLSERVNPRGHGDG